MSKKKIIIVSILSLFVVGLAAIWLYISTLITPEEIRKLVLENLQKTFPKSEITLEAVDYSVGLDADITIEKLKIALPEKKILLAEINSATVSIPVWSLLVGKGHFVLELDSPKVNYSQFSKESDNWSLAMGPKKESKQEAPKVESQKTKEKVDQKGVEKKVTALSLPAFVMKAKADIRVNNLEVSYSLLDNTNGKVNLDKFLVKNFNFEEETAFEIRSRIFLAPAKGKDLSLSLLVIGQVGVHNYFQQKPVSLLTLVTVSDIQTNLVPYSLPDIKDELKVKLSSDGVIVGSNSLKVGELAEIKNEFSLKDKQVVVSKIDGKVWLQKILNLLQLKLDNIKAEKGLLSFGGKVQLEDKKITPDFSFELSPGVSYQFEDQNIEVAARGKFRNSKIQLDLLTKLFGGNFDVYVKGQFDPNKIVVEPHKLKPFSIDVSAANWHIKKEWLAKVMKPKDEEKKKVAKAEVDATTGAQKAKKVATPLPLLPPGKISLNFNHIKLGNETVALKGGVDIAQKSVQVKNLKLTHGEGFVEVNTTTNLSSKAIVTNLKTQIQKFNLQVVEVFLPKMIQGTTGETFGKVEGEITMPLEGDLSYAIRPSITVKNGELKGINFTEYVKTFVEKIPPLKKQLKGDKLKIDQSIDLLSFKGSLTPALYHIQKAIFKNSMIDLHSFGKVYSSPTKDSKVTLKVKGHKGYVKKALDKVELQELVVLLEGKGFALAPNYESLTAQLAKGGVRKGVKKLLKSKKAKKYLDNKKTNKLKEKLLKNKKVNKLLKGLF